MKTSTKIRQDAKRLFRLCLVADKMDEQRVRLVTDRVLGNKHRGYIVLLTEFLRLIKLARAAQTAEILSAEPLADDFRLRVQAALERSYGAGIATSFVHDPALIGGMRIKVGSDVYDGSVRTRLTSLERRFEL
jgi:F-type H+-transporting ATPase subunit delta